MFLFLFIINTNGYLKSWSPRLLNLTKINNPPFILIPPPSSPIKHLRVPELYGDHLEAGTRVAFHGVEANPGNIVICANDTDIMVVLLVNAKKFSSHIWYDCGLDSVNTRCYVDITNLAKTISYVDALPRMYVCIYRL